MQSSQNDGIASKITPSKFTEDFESGDSQAVLESGLLVFYIFGIEMPFTER